MANRTALDPKFKPIRRCEMCRGIIDDVVLDKKTRRWRLRPSYDALTYCSRKCAGNALKAGNPGWLRRFFPDYEPPA